MNPLSSPDFTADDTRAQPPSPTEAKSSPIIEPTSPNPPPLETPPEQKIQPTPEQQTELAGQAMMEFRAVFDSLSRLETADADYFPNVGNLVNRIANLATSGEYRRDTLSPLIDRISGEFGQAVRQQIGRLKPQSEQLGSNRNQAEAQMNSLLQQIITAEDPNQKASLIQSAFELFQQTTSSIDQSRASQKTGRDNMTRAATQNLTIAKQKRVLAEAYTRLDERSAPYIYALRSQSLITLITEKNTNLSAMEKGVATNNFNSQQRFNQILRQLNLQNETTEN